MPINEETMLRWTKNGGVRRPKICNFTFHECRGCSLCRTDNKREPRKCVEVKIGKYGTDDFMYWDEAKALAEEVIGEPVTTYWEHYHDLRWTEHIALNSNGTNWYEWIDGGRELWFVSVDDFIPATEYTLPYYIYGVGETLDSVDAGEFFFKLQQEQKKKEKPCI